MEEPPKTCCYDRFAFPSIIRLMAEPYYGSANGEVTYQPETYLAGCHEVLALTFIVTWALAFFISPDKPPVEFNYRAEISIASLAMIMSSFNVGLGYRYMWLRATRSRLERSRLEAAPNSCVSRYNGFASVVLAISTNFCLCMWLIPNKTTPEAEVAEWVLPPRAIARAIIACYACTLYGAYLGNLLENLSGPRSECVRPIHKVFAAVYGLCVCYLVFVYGNHFLQKDQHKTSLITQVFLVVWTGCCGFVNSFMPEGQALVVSMQVGKMGDPGDEAEGDDEPRNCNCPAWLVKNSSIAYILNQRLDSRKFYPKYYLGATHEIFGVTLIITWLLTLAVPKFRPQIFEHPARMIIGSFNPCFGWDYFPASWISVGLCSFNVYFSYRYAWLKLVRKDLLKEPNTVATRFNNVATYAFSLSSNLWLCLWLIGPNPKDPFGGDPDGPEIFWWSLHTGIFVFYANSAYLAFLGNILDIASGPRAEHVTGKIKVFTTVYGLAVAYLLFVYVYSLANFEHGAPQPALGSGIFTQVADFVWMACVGSVTSMLPAEPPLLSETRVEKTVIPQQALKGESA